MTDEHSPKVRHVGSLRTPSPEYHLRKALRTYVRDARLPEDRADVAYRAVMKALGMPEDPPTP
jgi:hypothetical protein